jgi:hypothetical protein
MAEQFGLFTTRWIAANTLRSPLAGRHALFVTSTTPLDRSTRAAAGARANSARRAGDGVIGLAVAQMIVDGVEAGVQTEAKEYFKFCLENGCQ